MHKLYELKEKLMRELEDYSENGKFSKDDVESIKYITSAIDHICNIMEDSDEYSNAMDASYTNGMYGKSYARGRRRDSMGRYSNRMYSRNGYSYAEDTVAELKEIMQDAPDHIKGEIRKTITKIEQM